MTKYLDYKEIHELVDSRPNMFWDGWTVVVVNTKQNGFMHKTGIFYKGKWATASRIHVNKYGKWPLKEYHVK